MPLLYPLPTAHPPTHPDAAVQERYAVPRAAGLYRELPSPSDCTARNIIHRIVDQRAAFEARNKKKVKGEEAYYSGAKQYVQEL